MSCPLSHLLLFVLQLLDPVLKDLDGCLEVRVLQLLIVQLSPVVITPGLQDSQENDTLGVLAEVLLRVHTRGGRDVIVVVVVITLVFRLDSILGAIVGLVSVVGFIVIAAISTPFAVTSIAAATAAATVVTAATTATTTVAPDAVVVTAVWIGPIAVARAVGHFNITLVVVTQNTAAVAPHRNIAV